MDTRIAHRMSLLSEAMFGVEMVPRPGVVDVSGSDRVPVAQAADVGRGEVPSGAPAPSAPMPPSCARPAETADGAARQRKLDALRIEHDAACAHCTTATAHTRTVFGEGDPAAALMFVGEAPGETEDRLGRPFVGRAGEKLDEIIRAMGLRREQVYIANVLKSRPPENRTPLQHEVEACGPWLRRQIAIVRPQVIVTLGGPATKLLLGVEQGITRLRGIWAAYRDGSTEIPALPTYHPAYLLRNPLDKARAWDDLRLALDVWRRASSD